MFRPAPRYRAVSFLEVGCGSGRNLLLARASQLCRPERTAGFDINPVAIEIGRETFGPGEDLEVADALEYDYGGFDVICSFRPFRDFDLQRRLEAHMAATMRKDAYLVAPYSLDLGL
ncbi:MAG: class I SAM-dependent methyltransferase [Jhaorihella sp.]